MLGRIDESGLKDVKIDLKDKKLLGQLVANSRVPLTTIAKKVGLSRDAIRYRIKRLQKFGVIRAFIPLIDFEAFDYLPYHCFFRIYEVSEEKRKRFFSFLDKHQNITSILSYSDKWDLELTILAKSIKELDSTLSAVTNKYPGIIEAVEVFGVTKQYVEAFLPENFIEYEHAYTKIKKEKKLKAKFDKKDLELLKALSADCRKNSYELAEKIKLSPDAVAYRLKKMQDSGIIKGYTTLVNLSALGYELYCLFIKLKSLTKEQEVKIGDILKDSLFIINAVKTIGTWGIIAWLVTKEPEQFHKAIRELRKSIGQLFQEYDTLMAYKEQQFKAWIPVLKPSK